MPCQVTRDYWAPRGRGCCCAAAGRSLCCRAARVACPGSRKCRRSLPDRLEPGTLNVPGIAGLTEGLRYLNRVGTETVFAREHRQMRRCAAGLQKLEMAVFSGPHQASTLSFLPGTDCEEAAEKLAGQGIALRAGLHCAPYAHESAGTLNTGTLRVSFGWDADDAQTDGFLRAASKLSRFPQ